MANGSVKIAAKILVFQCLLWTDLALDKAGDVHRFFSILDDLLQKYFYYVTTLGSWQWKTIWCEEYLEARIQIHTIIIVHIILNCERILKHTILIVCCPKLSFFQATCFGSSYIIMSWRYNCEWIIMYSINTLFAAAPRKPIPYWLICKASISGVLQV